MKPVLEVVPGHPLSQTHVFDRRLSLKNGRRPTSIRHAFYYIKLLQHGQIAAAERLLSDGAIPWNVDRVQQFADNQIEEENVNFLVKSGDVMRAILLHQIEYPSNPFRQALKREMDCYKHPKDIVLRVYTGHKEMVFTSGHRYGEWKTEIPGFNVYAELLRELVEIIHDKKSIKNPLLDEMLTNFSFFNPHVPRSILLVSDSQARLMNEIEGGGDVVPVGGGKYQEMIDVLQNPKFELSQYKWIVVYCGINCNVKPGYAFSRRDEEWQRLKTILVNEAARRDRPSVLFCCSFDHPNANRDNPLHAAYIERQLAGTGVLCVNWQRMGDPFLLRKGLLDYSLFNVKGKNPNKWYKEIHVNNRGLRVLWKTFCAYLEGLMYIHYSENKTPKSVPKTVYKPPPPLPVQDFYQQQPGPSGLQITLSEASQPGTSKLQITVPGNVPDDHNEAVPPKRLKLSHPSTGNSQYHRNYHSGFNEHR